MRLQIAGQACRIRRVATVRAMRVSPIWLARCAGRQPPGFDHHARHAGPGVEPGAPAWMICLPLVGRSSGCHALHSARCDWRAHPPWWPCPRQMARHGAWCRHRLTPKRRIGWFFSKFSSRLRVLPAGCYTPTRDLRRKPRAIKNLNAPIRLFAPAAADCGSSTEGITALACRAS